jgi:hypothetical protein
MAKEHDRPIGSGESKQYTLQGFRQISDYCADHDFAIGYQRKRSGVAEKSKSVATILERELEPIINEWLRRVNLIPSLTLISLSDEDRTFHLLELSHDIVCRLRLERDAQLPISNAATAHGQKRREQGYSPAMLVEESRVLEVVTFRTLQLHLSELDHGRVLSDIAVIVDEVDFQLMQAVTCWRQVPSARSNRV